MSVGWGLRVEVVLVVSVVVLVGFMGVWVVEVEREVVAAKV